MAKKNPKPVAPKLRQFSLMVKHPYGRRMTLLARFFALNDDDARSRVPALIAEHSWGRRDYYIRYGLVLKRGHKSPKGIVDMWASAEAHPDWEAFEAKNPAQGWPAKYRIGVRRHGFVAQ